MKALAVTGIVLSSIAVVAGIGYGATKLRVYPPNDYGYLSVVSPITGRCPGFQVGPVVAE